MPSNFQSQSFSITSGTTSLYQLYYTSFVIESFIATKQLSPCIPTLIYLSASKNPSEGSFIGTTCSSEAVGLVVGPSSSFHVHVHVLWRKHEQISQAWLMNFLHFLACSMCVRIFLLILLLLLILFLLDLLLLLGLFLILPLLDLLLIPLFLLFLLLFDLLLILLLLLLGTAKDISWRFPDKIKKKDAESILRTP